ncbi:MAG: nitroreductase family protein [Candidatus Gygaella obscura]|nr:nitroreductase family protein [Candidatus Gygaella obscura]
MNTRFLDLVNKRQSVRKYDSRPVARDDIESCLEAARLAPSACNSQPWEFIVVDDKVKKERVANAMLKGIYGMNTFIKYAPVLVVVAVDNKSWFTRLANVLRDTKMYLVDIGIACEHFVLRATELDIGTCWLGWFNEKALKKELSLARNKRVDIVISMGYSFEDNESTEKTRKPLSIIRKFI